MQDQTVYRPLDHQRHISPYARQVQRVLTGIKTKILIHASPDRCRENHRRITSTRLGVRCIHIKDLPLAFKIANVNGTMPNVVQILFVLKIISAVNRSKRRHIVRVAPGGAPSKPRQATVLHRRRLTHSAVHQTSERPARPVPLGPVRNKATRRGSNSPVVVGARACAQRLQHWSCPFSLWWGTRVAVPEPAESGGPP